MVAAIVLDAEVAVARHRVRELRAPLIKAVRLVAQLVAHGDGGAGTHARSNDKTDPGPHRRVGLSRCYRRGQEGKPENRHGKEQQHPVIRVRRHGLDHFFGRVVRIDADKMVSDNVDAIIEDHGNQGPPGVTGREQG